MRVRVWISGADGPSHDFELVEAPRVGERIVVGVGSATEEGIVSAVTWHLQAIEPAAGDLPLAVEPLGAVTLVHVICRPASDAAAVAAESVALDMGALSTPPH